MEEKYANLVGQICSLTERLDHTEHDLDLERISREEIIRSEVERWKVEFEEQLRAEYAEKQRQLDQDKKEYEDKLEQRYEKRESDLKDSYANLTQKFIAETQQKIDDVLKKADSNGKAKMAAMFDVFLQAYLKIGDRNSQEGQDLLRKWLVRPVGCSADVTHTREDGLRGH